MEVQRKWNVIKIMYIPHSLYYSLLFLVLEKMYSIIGVVKPISKIIILRKHN